MKQKVTLCPDKPSARKRTEMFEEPVAGEAGDIFQSAAFFKIVRYATNNRKQLLHREHFVSVLVDFDGFLVQFAHDEQGGGLYSSQRIACQIRSSTASNHGTDILSKIRRRDESAACARAGAEESDAQVARFIFVRHPMSCTGETLGEQSHVETVMCAASFLGAFLGREQFNQQRAKASLAEQTREFRIALAPLRSGVGEDDETFGVGGHDEFAVKSDGPGGDTNTAGRVARLQPVSFSAHNLPFHP